MTEKRFTYKHFDWLQWHIFDNGDFYIEVTDCEKDAKKLCDLLNCLNEENEELYEENKRLREILEYSTIKCKHLVPHEEGDYCMKTNNWFFDFEGYEDYCPTCEYCERR